MRVFSLLRFGPTRALIDARRRVDRLEIEVRRLQLAYDALAEDLVRLSDRLCAAQGRVGGALGGRPSRAKVAAHGQQLRLDEIPQGDKAALRAYFRDNPPKDNQEH